MAQNLRDDELAVQEIAKENLVSPLIKWFTIFVIFCLFGVVMLA